MRKASIMLLAVALTALCLSGCGADSKPQYMSDTGYRMGQKAVEITEQYLNLEIDADEAHAQLGDVYDRLESQETSEIQDNSVKSVILSLQAHLLSGADDSVIDETLERLKDILKG